MLTFLLSPLGMTSWLQILERRLLGPVTSSLHINRKALSRLGRYGLHETFFFSLFIKAWLANILRIGKGFFWLGLFPRTETWPGFQVIWQRHTHTHSSVGR